MSEEKSSEWKFAQTRIVAVDESSMVSIEVKFSILILIWSETDQGAIEEHILDTNAGKQVS